MNVPVSYILTIEKLVGKNEIYPSRAELVRVAVREFLLKELRMARNISKYNEPEIDDFDHENYVKVPTKDREDNGGQPVHKFTTYKILRRLEL